VIVAFRAAARRALDDVLVAPLTGAVQVSDAALVPT
jgi:hypothetical protein